MTHTRLKLIDRLARVSPVAAGEFEGGREDMSDERGIEPVECTEEGVVEFVLKNCEMPPETIRDLSIEMIREIRGLREEREAANAELVRLRAELAARPGLVWGRGERVDGHYWLEFEGGRKEIWRVASKWEYDQVTRWAGPIPKPAEPGSETTRRPKVITLCGSTRFVDAYTETSRRLTLEGHIVISVGLFGHVEGLDMDGPVKAMLDELHLRKIDMSDEVFVINPDGYIGESTRREIEYARHTGKVVRFLEPAEPGPGREGGSG